MSKFFNVKFCTINYLFENYIIGGETRVTTLVTIIFIHQSPFFSHTKKNCHNHHILKIKR
jgi:hypothetical protein